MFSIEITADRRFTTKCGVMVTIGTLELLKMTEGASKVKKIESNYLSEKTY